MTLIASPLNTEALAYYLTYQFVPKPYQLIDKSDPTNYLFPKHYDSIHNFKLSETEIAENLFKQLGKSINKSLNTSSDIGLLLSGGFDSAALLFLLKQNTDRPIHTLSGAYSSNTSHLKICSALAKKFSTIHQELIFHPKDLLKLPDIYNAGIASPIGDNGYLATNLMIKELSKRTKLIFSGDGADCLYQGLQAHYSQHMNSKENNSEFSQKIISDYLEYEHYKYNEIFLNQQEANKLLSLNTNLLKPLHQTIQSIACDDPIKKTILLDLNFLVTNRVHYISNSAEFYHSEVKLPFLDQDLIDFTLRIPSQYFIKDKIQKYILKEAFRGKLPAKIIHQKKKGMTPPFHEWFTANKSFILNSLRQAKELGLTQDYTHYLVKHLNSSNQYSYGMRIWLILNLVHWFRHQECAAGTRL